MTHDIVMPQLGITMTEGFVMRWLKAAGDSIEKGEPLFIVQTDKVDMEVESPGKGFVTEILVNEEVTVPVGTLIARVSDSIAAKKKQIASPRARRIAQELGIALTAITGTGESGRIREVDVRASAANRPSPPIPTEEDRTAPAAMSPVPSARTEDDRSAAAARRRTAERMEESARTVPHFCLRRELDAGPLTAMREQLLSIVEARHAVRLTITDFLIKAMAAALCEVPLMNASWRQDRVEQHSHIHIGFAAQSASRLLVPVIHDVHGLPIPQLAMRRAELTAKAKDGTLEPMHMQGASCTLSNLGSFGVDEFEAIINPPESCILAAGRIAPRPFVVNGQLVVRPTLKLSLTVDHRVADGVAAALFLDAVARAIQQPALLLLS